MKGGKTQNGSNLSSRGPQIEQRKRCQKIAPATTTTTATTGIKKQNTESSPTMIATSGSNNSTSASVLHMGGVWVEHRHGDGSTVCSDITSDHTSVAGMGMSNVYNANGGLEALLGTLPNNNNNNGSVASPPSTTVEQPNNGTPSTPSTVQSTPSRKASPPTETTQAQSPSSSPLAVKQLALNSPTPKSTTTTKKKKAAAPASSVVGSIAKAKTTGLADDGSFTDKPGKQSSSRPTAAAAAKRNIVQKAVPMAAANMAAFTAKTAKHPSPIMDVPPSTAADAKSAATKTVSKKKSTAAAAAAAPNTKAHAKPTPKPSISAAVANAKLTASAKPAPNSQQQQPANNNAGLSELSKQLRVQRAKNEWQHNEIARLERQLKILSDLKGVSVADLRHSLESACQEEAHDELRNQVSSLQAQLEALQMQQTSARRRASTATNEATHQKIATLQLRIGELEEVDQSKQNELQTLYQKCQEQQARATRLEKTNQQQQAQLEQFEQASKVYNQDVERMRAERDKLQQQVAELQQKLQDQQAAQKLEAEMRDIERQIAEEKQRKAQYLAQARSRGGAAGGGGGNHYRNSSRDAPVNNQRLSNSQLEAIQGAVGRHAGFPQTSTSAAAAAARETTPCDVSTTTSTANTASSFDYSEAATGSQGHHHQHHVFGLAVRTEEDDTDTVSHLGDDMDMSVHTMDALRMQGMSEEQANEIIAKDTKISQLYQELRQHATRASELETLVANQKAQMEHFIRQLDVKEDIVKSTKSNYEFAKSEHDSLYKRFCDIELQLTLEQEKVQGLEGQLNARLHENNLRNDQFKCRFQVQNERIADLEQQQQSLYAAFELLQQEVRQQDNEHTKLRTNLDEADSEVARQLLESDKKQGTASPSTANDDSQMDQHNVPPHVALAESHSSLDADPVREFQQLGLDYPMRQSGFLWKLDKLKGWKRRFFVLYGSGGVYHMTYSDGPRERVKGRIDRITMGVSMVAETNKSIKKPFSFVLHVDPLDNSAAVLYAASMNADDFTKWMAALKNATIRPEDSAYISHSNTLSWEAQQAAEQEASRQYEAVSSDDLRLDDRESQMEADRLMAMRMNIQNQNDQAFA